VKRPRGHAIATTRVSMRASVGQIRGGGACSHTLSREWAKWGVSDGPARGTTHLIVPEYDDLLVSAVFGL
jgi:hypothetical protein